MNLARVAAARHFLGCPFEHQGRAVWGMDCAGLLVVTELALGRVLSETYQGYGRTPHAGRLRAAVAANFTPVTRAPEPGDVVLMRLQREPQHVGIVGDYGHGELSLIHSYSGVGQVVETILDDRWRRRILEVFE